MPSMTRTTQLYKSVGHIITFHIQSSGDETAFILHYEGNYIPRYLIKICTVFEHNHYYHSLWYFCIRFFFNRAATFKDDVDVSPEPYHTSVTDTRWQLPVWNLG